MLRVKHNNCVEKNQTEQYNFNGDGELPKCTKAIYQLKLNSLAEIGASRGWCGRYTLTWIDVGQYNKIIFVQVVLIYLFMISWLLIKLNYIKNEILIISSLNRNTDSNIAVGLFETDAHSVVSHYRLGKFCPSFEQGKY